MSPRGLACSSHAAASGLTRARRAPHVRNWFTQFDYTEAVSRRASICAPGARRPACRHAQKGDRDGWQYDKDPGWSGRSVDHGR